MLLYQDGVDHAMAGQQRLPDELLADDDGVELSSATVAQILKKRLLGAFGDFTKYKG